ncbi:MAG: CheR family methyltransferase [Syntrophobacteraceae bacterium]|nr:CheR family methyltransferase [Syntrophobacteraceae bacterium]
MKKDKKSGQPEQPAGETPPSPSTQITPVKSNGRNSKKTFYIVGIGSSAGGLEALEQFFTHVSPNCGLAFVVVSHLDPTQKGMMPELLQRFTKMKVYQAEDGLKVAPDHVYVIPPNKDLSILHGTLQLLEPTASRGLRLPIDFFLKHLAEDQRERSIAIILSGMGSDGTLGLSAVKEKLGMVMVQDIRSAKADGMPRSAIGTGLVDYTAPAEHLPAKLMDYVQHARMAATAPRKTEVLVEKTSGMLQNLFVLLRAQTGHDFSFYKKSTIYRRIERRMTVHQIADMSLYVRYLQENAQEIDLLFAELLIGVTSFFRDPESFEALQKEVEAYILEGRKRGGTLRIWVPGCSTGEEVYSIAIILMECLAGLGRKGRFKVQIFATDIHKEGIEKARQGVYLPNIAAQVSPERLAIFFTREESGAYRIKKEIRELVVFAPQNLIMDPPFTKLDILSCRNLLIYLTPELQKKLLPLFHYCLNPGGILTLGTAETIGNFTDLFSVSDSKWKIFSRKESASAIATLTDFPSDLSFANAERATTPPKSRAEEGLTVPELVQAILLKDFSPSAVLINDKGDIVYVHARTGKYLELAAEKANLNIYALAREGLKQHLGSAIRRALAEKTDVTLKGLRVRTDGDDQVVHLTVKPLSEPDAMRGLLLVVFDDAPSPSPARTSLRKKRDPAGENITIVEACQTELQQTRELLQSTIEEMTTSQEELKSANEELQSTNEELTTSQEEMQSLNEELMTVNAELQHKIDELSRSSSDMKNLLNSTSIATLFLDNNMQVKRFTTSATDIIRLIPTDVGRPVGDISSCLKGLDMTKEALRVLDSLVFKEKEVQTTDDRSYLMRISPYRTIDNVIDGVVVTFTDISPLKDMERSLRESRDLIQRALKYAESIVATVRTPLLVLDAQLKVVSASNSFYRNFMTTPEETEKEHLYNLGNRQWDIPALRQILEGVLSENKFFEDYPVEHEFPEIGHRKILLNARQIEQADHGRQGPLILLAIEDVTDQPGP